MKINIKLIIALFLSIIINSFFLIQLLSLKANPILSRYVNLESERITSNVVDGIITKILSDELKNDLYIIEKNEKGEIQTVEYNTNKVNKILNLVSTKIQEDLILLEEGKIKKFSISDSFYGKRFKYVKDGIVCELPMGSLSGSTLLSNIGPIIPIKMSFLGQVSCNLKSRVTNYGINNVYLETSIHVEIKQRITMPTMSKDSTIKVDAPVTIKIIFWKTLIFLT